MFEEITIDGDVVVGDGTDTDGECYSSGNCDVVGVFRRGVCENPDYQNSQLLCEAFSVWNTDEEICVGWRYADSNGSSYGILMGKEGEEGDNSFTYMNSGEIPYLKIYDSSYGTILDLNPSDELPGWELNAIEFIEGTSTAWNEGIGCTNPQACNYDEDATINYGCLENDCMGGCGGNAFQNECNVCVGGNTGNPLDAGLDCMGECFGGAQIDVCGVCNGPGSVYGCGCSEISEGDCDCEGNNTFDCFGVCGGDAIVDCFGVCGGNAVLDCSGVCGGSAVVDECDECGGEGIDEGACDCDGNILDCAGACGGSAVVDECNVCGGEGIDEGACDCDGNILDCAGACGGDGDYLADGTTCCASGNIDCNDVCNGLANYNDCFVCVGGDTGLTEDTGIDCLGACWGSAVEDECGVCGGGCATECDLCGVCGGDDSSCPECDLGDVNCDGYLDVLDVVITINIVLVDGYDAIGDMNQDGQLDILDIVILINLIVNAEGVIMDIDGNVYLTVQIGDQLWMAENLKVTHYNNGDEIPNIINGEDWGSYDEGQYVVYDNAPYNAEIYGNLYNWAVTVDDRGVCPEGWHVPSDEEFMELEMELGMSEEDANSSGYRGTDEGSKLAGNSDLWDDGILENNSEFGTSGFIGIPAGYREESAYSSIGIRGSFWSSSEANSTSAKHRRLYCNNSSVFRYGYSKLHGYSIRCLRD